MVRTTKLECEQTVDEQFFSTESTGPTGAFAVFFSNKPRSPFAPSPKNSQQTERRHDVAELASIQPASTHLGRARQAEAAVAPDRRRGRARHSEGLRSHVKTGHGPRQAQTHSDRDSADDHSEAISTLRT